MPRLATICAALAVVILMVASCGDDDPAAPAGSSTQFLAGGGRQADNDAFSGGPEDSGPGRPDFEPPSPDLLPLFYADVDCREDASTFLIGDAEAWQAWWTDAIACLGPQDPAKSDPDTGTSDPDTIFYSYPDEAPPVDFATSTVYVIALAREEIPGRSVWVQDVTPSEVHYMVSRLGDDCFDGREPVVLAGSPTVAVVGPLATEPDQLTWRREDVLYDCSWEPDPNLPLALYYTDAPCDLGPEHAVITDAAALEAWLATAFACDQARWYGPDGIPVPEDSTATPPPVPSPGWLGLEIDFTTHAVIVLRGDEQARWGGGVWLAAVNTAAGGTTIDYTVVAAGENCPPVDDGTTVRPTVAIRLPLPLSEPITWRRTTETVACDWEDGGVDSSVVRPPRP